MLRAWPRRVGGVERPEVVLAAAALRPGLVPLDLDLGGQQSGRRRGVESASEGG
ncbi:MAG: hypothetical protein ACRD0K_24800 [Egibacteraceae bacterium]